MDGIFEKIINIVEPDNPRVAGALKEASVLADKLGGELDTLAGQLADLAVKDIKDKTAKQQLRQLAKTIIGAVLLTTLVR